MENESKNKNLNRQEEIHKKGFDLTNFSNTDYNRIKVGSKTLNDLAVNVKNDYTRGNKTLGDKDFVLKAIAGCDFITLREISNYYFRTSGIYSRILEYLANIHKYDWYMTPIINGNITKKNILNTYYSVLKQLDDFQIKAKLSNIALQVLINGCYYGYIEEMDTGVILQELPIKYCRSRYSVYNHPAVEFNIKFFTDCFKDTDLRTKAVKAFPKEFQKAYASYLNGTLKKDFNADETGWFLLDVNKSTKINLKNADYPLYISIIPKIIDLGDAQVLDKNKTLQRLTKLVIQQLPLDKNDNLLFDMEEGRQIHNNAAQMLSGTIGAEVLTSFASVKVEDMDGDSDQQDDDLSRTERQLYNDAGISELLFNSESATALERTIIKDTSIMSELLPQFEVLLQMAIASFNTNKKVFYKVQLLPTTFYNYNELSKLYKEQLNLGFSFLLPQISAGIPQSTILHNLKFENEYLELPARLTPPISTNTASAADIKGSNSESNSGGRPEKTIEEKSEQTLKNIESKENN